MDGAGGTALQAQDLFGRLVVAEDDRNRLHRRRREPRLDGESGQLSTDHAVADPARQEPRKRAAGLDIDVVDRERVPVGLGHAQQTAGSDHPSQLGEGAWRVLNVLQYPIHARPVHGGALQRQGVRVARAYIYVAMSCHPPACLLDHDQVVIDPDDRSASADRSREPNEVGSRPAPKVEDRLTGPQDEGIEETLLITATCRRGRSGVEVLDLRRRRGQRREVDHARIQPDRDAGIAEESRRGCGDSVETLGRYTPRQVTRALGGGRLMDPIVSTTNGEVRGRIVDGVATFLGIPYAAAPFGRHRFRAPAPVERWEGVRDALEFGPTPPKMPYAPPMDRLLPDPSIPGDECLNLNVWTPDPAAGGLPVMVWIYGGSMRNGSSCIPVYDGHNFARDGVVLVSFNYRLGVEGFGLFRDAPANRGLLDVLAALRWVRANIGAFGGDPDNVTVFGESAGSILVGALVASPLAAGLFRRAVMQSGPPMVQTRNLAARTIKLIAKRLGAPATAAAFAVADRGAVLAAQVAVTRRGNPLTGANGFGIVVDGHAVPAEPMPALTSGAGREIDLLIGYNSEEYRLWFVPTGVVDRINRLTLRLALAKFRISGRVAHAYRINRPAARPGEILGAIATDMLLRIPINRLADSRRGDNTFVYEFGWPSPVDRLGACHALEIGFVFDNLGMPEAIAMTGDAAPQELADSMHRAWIDFAATGKPGWPGWDPSRPVMRFDLPTPEVTQSPREDERRLWR